MSTAASSLSDKALAVFAFAAYHQLESGQRVSSIVQRDGAGHRADDTAVRELTERGLVRRTGTPSRSRRRANGPCRRLWKAFGRR